MSLLTALLCQILAIATTNLLYKTGWPLPVNGLLWIQPLLAALISRLFRQPKWWLPIHLVFSPAIWLFLTFQIPGWIYLSAFLISLAVFWGTFKGDVPLFLSSNAVSDSLASIVQQQQATNLIDLGAGIGSAVISLARQMPKLEITAVERAPLPWLILRWRCRRFSNIKVIRQNLWDTALTDYDIVFLFLSPLAMPRIQNKCMQEMRTRSLVVSSSFEMPLWPAESILQLKDTKRTHLFCYRLPEKRGF
jgi:Precorrin-6B methylase 2